MVEYKKVENSAKFRQAAIRFQKMGFYIAAPRGTTAHREYWDEERRRCIEGYTADDEDFITGYNYFYVNYSQIVLVSEKEVTLRSGKKRMVKVRIRDFPKFYDWDHYFFNAVEEAEIEGKHLVVLKARGKGYSFKCASMLCRNFYLIPESKSYGIASEAEFLLKDGILTKAWDFMDFVDSNTAWFKKRQKTDTKIHKRASFVVDVDGVKTEVGYRSEIMGITLKNDPQKARGKRGKLILWEEAGKFPGLKQAWQIAQPSVEEDGVAFGLMIAFGCVCAGTEVISKKGEFIKIEELKQKDGVLGYNTYGSVAQDIEHFREPYETECYKITTNSGRKLECSHNHPIVYSHRTLSKRVPGKRKENLHMKTWKWQKASEFKVGDQVGVIEEVPFFGDKNIWEPRVVGWLIGDGSYGFNKTPVLSNCELELNEYIDNNFDTAIEKSYLTKTKKLYRETRIKGICGKLRDLGIYGQTKEKKRLPELIFDCKKEDVCELIGGLFDTDGYITGPKSKSGHRINLSSAYKELLDEVLKLLLKLGIHGKIHFIKPYKSNPKDKNGYYRLEIADTKSLVTFVNTIKFYPKEKSRRLDLYRESLKRKRSELSKYLHGIRFERVISVESIGVKKVYNITASDTHTYIANGFITHNTGGTEDADYDGLKDLFYEPDAYNALPFENVWDEGATKPCGFFVPEFANMTVEDEDGHPLMDEHGNSQLDLARGFATQKRQVVIENASDKRSVDRYIAERPFNPMEATLQLAGNIFPKTELARHLAYIRTNETVANYKQVGDLQFAPDGELEWLPASKPRDLTKYKLTRNDDPAGQIVIWEHPVTDPPYGLYIAGCLLPGEQVLTNKGLMSVEDVDLKNKLINKDGKEVKINTLLRYDKKNESVYKVHMSNVDRPTTYTHEHPLYLSEDIGTDFSFIRMRDAKEGMWTKYPNIYNKEKKINIGFLNKEGKNLLLEDDFWWFVGHWLGDGFNHKSGYNYTVYNSFGIKEEEYLNKYKGIVRKIFNRKPNLKLQNGSNTHKFEYKDLFLFLEGNFGKYAHGKYIPEWVKYIPKKYKLQLILGYLDSDGSVYKDRSLIRASFKSINRKLLNDVQDILFSLGIVSVFNLSSRESVYNINGKTGKTKEAYSLQIRKTELKKLADKYKSDFNSRKLRLAKTIELLQKPRKNKTCILSEDNKYIYIKIKSIEKNTYTGVVYNFDCETHSFISQYCTGHNCDPYDHDKAGTDSLGSTFIYKRFQNFESYYDVIVAEYTGRPESAEEYYENVRKLLLYYRATVLFENERKGIYPYFQSKHQDYLLADQPDIISEIIKDSKVQRRKGIHMVTGIKDWGEIQIRDWLNEEYEPGKKNLTRIFSEALLEELISYNDDGNFDRVIALMMIMIYKAQLHHLHVKKKEGIEKNRRLITDGGLFKDYKKLPQSWL